jgi:hypothetical protein
LRNITVLPPFSTARQYAPYPCIKACVPEQVSWLGVGTGFGSVAFRHFFWEGIVMWASVIAVIGTLAGGLTTGLLQARVSRTARQDDRAAARWEAQVANSSAMVAALADHRQAIWRCEDLRLNAAAAEEIAEARAAARITRSAITGPMTTLSLLAPELIEPARAAARATYVLRDVPDRATLDTLLQAARDANGRLVAAARAYLA